MRNAKCGMRNGRQKAGKPLTVNRQPSIIQIYTGNGKGKTTAAMGLVLRAAASGKKVLFCQFLKDGNLSDGAAMMLAGINGVKVVTFKQKSPFFEKKTDLKKLKLDVIRDFTWALNTAKKGGYGLLVLDEFTYAVSLGLIKEGDVLTSLKNRLPSLEVVITGRGASKKLVSAAGLVTEMKEVKHPFRHGIRARRGIEY